MTRMLRWDIPVDGQEHVISSGWVKHVATLRNPDVVHVWTEEPAGLPKVDRVVTVIGTGMQYPGGSGGEWAHLGTAIAAEGRLEWHVIHFVPEIHGYIRGGSRAR